MYIFFIWYLYILYIFYPNEFYNYLVSALKRQLDFSRGLLKELVKYEKDQEITFNVYNQKKSETKQYKKKLLNDQQKQVIFIF